MEGPGRVEGRSVLVRVFRDQTEMRRALAEIVGVSMLGFPLAVNACGDWRLPDCDPFVATTRRHGAAGTPDYFGIALETFAESESR